MLTFKELPQPLRALLTPVSDHEEAVDVAGIAWILGVSVDTIYQRARSGEIPAFRIGRVWRFWPSRVQEHLDQQATALQDPWAMPPASRRARRAEAHR